MSLRRTPLQRKAPLRRTRLKKKLPKRLKRRSEFAPWLAFVRTLPCVSCHRVGHSQAAHVVTAAGQKGIGMKVSDAQAVPLCGGAWGCHEYFDGLADGPKNPFRGLTKEQRRELAAEWVTKTQLAATPESYEHALELEALGLGEIYYVKDGDERAWVWKGLVTS